MVDLLLGRRLLEATTEVRLIAHRDLLLRSWHSLSLALEEAGLVAVIARLLKLILLEGGKSLALRSHVNWKAHGLSRLEAICLCLYHGRWATKECISIRLTRLLGSNVPLEKVFITYCVLITTPGTPSRFRYNNFILLFFSLLNYSFVSLPKFIFLFVFLVFFRLKLFV